MTPTHKETTMLNKNLMRDRQRPLIDLYKKEPAAAWVTDIARTEWSCDDPLHGTVVLGPSEPVHVPIAVHTAVGGDSDEAVPGDVLAAALASCIDSTIRIIANRMRIPLVALTIRASAEVDVRGTLCVDPNVPVAFQRMSLHISIQAEQGVEESKIKFLLQLAESCCVVLQTLRNGLPVAVSIENRSEQGARAPSSSAAADVGRRDDEALLSR